ncbi:hypothetical protein EPUL_004537, partial [Erysiphe pulchra]
MAEDEQKSRKAVTFSEGDKVIETNGKVRVENDNHFESEQPQSLSATISSEPVVESNNVAEKNKDAVQKKTSKPVEEENSAPAEDGGLDLSTMKKKKKNRKPKESAEDEFAAKIAALQIEGKEGINAANGSNAALEIYEGDMEKGTGLWQHNSEVKIPYDKLLSRFFVLLAQKNPDHLSSGSKSYKIPPPQCLREGNKKTIFANIAEICKRMKRTDEHVTSYLFAELGTSGSVDGSRRLVIKGRFQQKQIENVLRRYIMEYVTCKTCRSPDTELNKGENRLHFITCNSCGSRRSVTAIKTGFSAQVGKRRRQQ